MYIFFILTHIIVLHQCNRRSIKELIGCTTPPENAIRHHVYINQIEVHKLQPENAHTTESNSYSTTDEVAVTFDLSPFSTVTTRVDANNAAPNLADEKPTRSVTATSVPMQTVPIQVSSTPSQNSSILTERSVYTEATLPTTATYNFSTMTTEDTDSSFVPYDIDFFYRKRDFYKHNSTVDGIYVDSLLTDWPYFLHLGLVNFFYMFVRGWFFPLQWTHSLTLAFYSVYHLHCNVSHHELVCCVWVNNAATSNKN